MDSSSYYSLITTWSLDLSPATTSAPFISLLCKATLPAENFNTWLYNDFLYVRCHIFFLAHIISLLPASHTAFKHDTLQPGYNVLAQELDVFRAKALERGVELPVLSPVNEDYRIEAARSPEDVLAELEPHAEPGCADYMRFISLTLCGRGTGAEEPAYHWSTLLEALWMCERVYLDSMVAVRDSADFGKHDAVLQDMVRWWANDAFAAYVGAVEDGAEKARGEEGWRDEEARWAVGEVLVRERRFWDIATGSLC